MLKKKRFILAKPLYWLLRRSVRIASWEILTQPLSSTQKIRAGVTPHGVPGADNSGWQASCYTAWRYMPHYYREASYLQGDWLLGP
jgi:hypothetical protein